MSEPRVVIVGGGFAGLSAARSLAGAAVEVLLIDRHNYHLFQPLLYQVATAGLSPSEIAWPIRSLFRRQRNARVILGEITGVDTHTRSIRVGSSDVSYDYLVLATGARHAYFGHSDWEPYAPGLKTVDDATEIRRRILVAFEKAEIEPDTDKQRALLTFVIVGAGPTGVELAGAIIELAKKALALDFRRVDPSTARVVLVEAGERVLPAFPESLSSSAERALTKLGVETQLGQPVTSCDANGVVVGSKRVDAGTVIWAAGVAASPVATWLELDGDAAGRVEVTSDLSVPGHPSVFVIGDAARVHWMEQLVPGIAPAAKQMGHHVAKIIRQLVAGGETTPFVYRHYGNLATIGRSRAVIDFGWLRLTGWIAWWIWGLAHIYFLISLRNRALVAWQWLWSYLTFQRGARLITGDEK
jgi:NADH:ubiquinone reductase (H+-translocating)